LNRKEPGSSEYVVEEEDERRKEEEKGKESRLSSNGEKVGRKSLAVSGQNVRTFKGRPAPASSSTREKKKRKKEG